MPAGRQKTIDRTLTRTVVLTTAGALLTACVLFVLYDARAGRESLLERSEMLGSVVAINSAVPLTFQDEGAAKETLEGLTGARSVLAAAIYDASGTPFTRYLPQGRAGFSFPAYRSQGHEWSGGRLDVFQPIVFQGSEIGTLYLAFDTSSLTQRMTWYAMIVAVVMLGAAGFSYWVARRLRSQIARPLVALAEGTRAIAEGDLSLQIARTRDDEIGALAGTFNDMVSSLRGVVSQVRQSIGDVSEVSLALEERGGLLFRETQRQNAAIAEASSSVDQVGRSIRELGASGERLSETSSSTSSSIIELDASIGEIAAHMDQLSGRVDATSAAIDQVSANTDQVVRSVDGLESATDGAVGRLKELTASVREVEENAAASLNLSEESSREAEEGRSAVRETIDAMGDISSSFGLLEDRVNRLADKSRSIDAIVRVITDVAEQTGMLSLNAAIIAAQAGEHGRAFSVVADQVNNLADRSHRSAREIADLIRAVQEDTAAAVGAVQEGSSRVERGVQRSNVAGDVLNKILGATLASTERVRQIVGATQRQSENLARVDRAIQEVRGMVGQIKDSTHHQHAATAEIAKAVQSIRDLCLAVRQSTEEQRRGSHLITSSSSDLTAMVTEIAKALSSRSRPRRPATRAGAAPGASPKALVGPGTRVSAPEGRLALLQEGRPCPRRGPRWRRPARRPAARGRGRRARPRPAPPASRAWRATPRRALRRDRLAGGDGGSSSASGSKTRLARPMRSACRRRSARRRAPAPCAQAAHAAHQPAGAAEARQQAQVHLGLAEARLRRGVDPVAGEGQLAAAAQREAVHRGDRRDRQRLECGEAPRARGG
jgi:methyl-accepting chemotaxis protein